MLGQLTPPIALTLGDILTLMVVLSDNTATNMAIDRLGLEHINSTLVPPVSARPCSTRKSTCPPPAPCLPDQPLFGWAKRLRARWLRSWSASRPAIWIWKPGVDGDWPYPVPPGTGVVRSHPAYAAQPAGSRKPPALHESMDTSEHGSAIANKTGALDQVRNDVALISTKNGPVVIAGFTLDNADQRWNGDNEGEQTLGQAGAGHRQRAGRPAGLDAAGVWPWGQSSRSPEPSRGNRFDLKKRIQPEATTKPRPAGTGSCVEIRENLKSAAAN